MVHDYFDKNTFLCEMYDEDADEMRTLVLNFFPYDNSVQVIDTGKGKLLLRRVQLPALKLEMLQIGNVINVFSKLLYISDCAPATKRTLFKYVSRTFALIKPIPAAEQGKILTFITKRGFRITRMKSGKVNKDIALTLYQNISATNMLPVIVEYLISGEVIGLELVAENAVQQWRSCLGATDPSEAAPGTLRNLYGKSILKNIAHGCDSVESAEKMLDMFFGKTNGIPNVPYIATFKDCTCCVIKPHAVLDGNLGSILEHISTSNFTITSMAMFTIQLKNSYEFYEIYKDVVPEYEIVSFLRRDILLGLPTMPLNLFSKNVAFLLTKWGLKAMAIHLSEGKCVALEVKCMDTSLNSITEFRKLCGPRDPDVARQLFPNTIRALYGKDTVHNAVHCTDLSEDGELEVEYFFKLIAQSQG